MHKSIFLPVLLCVLYLGIYGEYLALWETECQVPVKVFPYPVSNYTNADYAMLSKGIPLSSPSDLSRLLDDYIS